MLLDIANLLSMKIAHYVFDQQATILGSTQKSNETFINGVPSKYFPPCRLRKLDFISNLTSTLFLVDPFEQRLFIKSSNSELIKSEKKA